MAHVVLEWEAAAAADLVADAIVAVLLQVLFPTPWHPVCACAVLGLFPRTGKCGFASNFSHCTSAGQHPMDLGNAMSAAFQASRYFCNHMACLEPCRTASVSSLYCTLPSWATALSSLPGNPVPQCGFNLFYEVWRLYTNCLWI